MTEILTKYGFVTSSVRSKIMRTIKSKNTKPELILRKCLWSRGIRYRLKNSDIIGNPDLSIRRKKIVIFVDGEFWHGYNWEQKKNQIKSNRNYWVTKIEKNIARDISVTNYLRDIGFTVIRFWGKEIIDNPEKCIEIIILALGGIENELR